MTVIQQEYGFTWDGVEVQRTSEFKGYRVLTVSTEAGASVTLYVSPAGKKIRVFKNNETELT